MTRGARPGLKKLYRAFGDRVAFVSVHVREAHPGDRYPHHASDEQKMRHAEDWARLDRIPWTVAADALDGRTHNAYGPLPNSAYLIDRTGHVAFRALWAGQEGLLRRRIDELVRREAAGEQRVDLGEAKNLVIPLLHGGAEFEHAVGRAGDKALEDFRREMGSVIYGMEKLMSRMRPLIHRPPEAA